MKTLDFYGKTYGATDEDAIVDVFLKNLKPGNRLCSYFVNWNKVLKNVEEVEDDLKILNQLIGREDFDDAFRDLVQKNPDVVTVIPLLAVRVGDGLTKFEIVTDYESGVLAFREYDFSGYNPEHLDRYLEFLDCIGIKDLLQSGRIGNLVDYMIGVESGVDSNARKNRVGTAMEEIVEIFIKDFCKKKGYAYLKEANAATVKKEFGYVVPADRQNRRYDFVVDDGSGPVIFEVNFYNSKGGSKLKAVAGEYMGVHNILKDRGIKFVWITDGPGWLSVKAGFSEAFHEVDYLFNLHMLEKGVLIEEF
ncbi:MAG: type II restriction endonuclease [Candidatus Kaiserbacteria bacterium]|nr:type II restriction endonuclease [Candidatus Kaiserbacteria bacterium]